jgi:hypothetical protein
VLAVGYGDNGGGSAEELTLVAPQGGLCMEKKTSLVPWNAQVIPVG